MAFFAAMALVCTAWAGKDKEEPQVRFELDLVDGSHIIGTPSIESVAVQTSYAKMDVSLKQILTIKIAEDHEKASIDLRNGDKLKGVINLKPIKLETAFGPVEINVEHIRKIEVVRDGWHGGNQGENKISVPANASADAGEVTKGQRYWYEATGQVGINVGGPNGGPATKADPDGRTISQMDGTATDPSPADGRFPCQGLATHSLVGIISGANGAKPVPHINACGEGMQPQSIGQPCFKATVANSGTADHVQLGVKGSFVAPASGRLTLLCNDCISGDNSGSWDVRISW